MTAGRAQTAQDAPPTWYGCLRPPRPGNAPARPSETDIRDAIERQWHGRPRGRGIPPIGELSDALGNLARLDGLYDVAELRPSERDDLDRLTAETIEPIRERVEAELLAALVEAGLEFARLHPDAPRAKLSVVR